MKQHFAVKRRDTRGRLYCGQVYRVALRCGALQCDVNERAQGYELIYVIAELLYGEDTAVS